MKKEQIITSAVMLVVSVLVLISVTIAWYTGNQDRPTVTGMQMSAAEVGEIKIALAPGGEDIKNLSETTKYADTGLNELTINIEKDAQGNVKIAPGTYGKITFYVTSMDVSVRSCKVVPMVQIQQTADGIWYPVSIAEDSGIPEAPDRLDAASAVLLEELYTIVHGKKAAGVQPAKTRHISFFKDEAGTQEIDEATPYLVEWSADEAAAKTEKPVTIYWKWHYEYPFTAEETATLNQTEKSIKINEYDTEDTKLGNHVKNMRFHFTFSTQ